MKAADVVDAIKPTLHPEDPGIVRRELLLFLAGHLYEGELKNGARIIDATDFSAWLVEIERELAARASVRRRSL